MLYAHIADLYSIQHQLDKYAGMLKSMEPIQIDEVSTLINKFRAKFELCLRQHDVESAVSLYREYASILISKTAN